MGNEQVNRGNARPGVYQKVINSIADDGICPFCPEHLTRIHPNPIEEKEHWIVTENAYPYMANKEHLLFIHKSHITNISELTASAWEELRIIINAECKKRSIFGGTFLMRFGDTQHTGATVEHLHCQLFQPDVNSPEYDPKTGVVVRIG